MNVLDAQAIAEENEDLKRQLAELRNTHSLVTSMLSERLHLSEPLDLVEMPGRVAAALDDLGVRIVKQRREIDALRENPLVTWEEDEGFQVNGVTVRAAVDPAVGGAELYTPCVPVSMIGKRGILRFTVAEEIPPGEAHFRNSAGELVGKIVYLGVDLAGGPDQTVVGAIRRAGEALTYIAGSVGARDHEWEIAAGALADLAEYYTRPPAEEPTTFRGLSHKFTGGEIPGELRDAGVVAFSEDFQTRDGEAAAHALDGEWLQPSTNPFGHGCCDCGLYHDVEWRLVDRDGDPIDLDELSKIYEVREEFAPISLQLAFTRNETETARLRAHQGRG